MVLAGARVRPRNAAKDGVPGSEEESAPGHSKAAIRLRPIKRTDMNGAMAKVRKGGWGVGETGVGLGEREASPDGQGRDASPGGVVVATVGRHLRRPTRAPFVRHVRPQAAPIPTAGGGGRMAIASTCRLRPRAAAAAFGLEQRPPPTTAQPDDEPTATPTSRRCRRSGPAICDASDSLSASVAARALSIAFRQSAALRLSSPA